MSSEVTLHLLKIYVTLYLNTKRNNAVNKTTPPDLDLDGMEVPSRHVTEVTSVIYLPITTI